MDRSFIDAVAFLVRDVVQAALGWQANTVRPANQEYPRGNASEEFATVLLNNAHNRGQFEYEDAEVKVADVVDGARVARHADALVDFTASVQFFKSRASVDAVGLPRTTNRAYDYAFRLPQLLGHPEVVLRLRKYGIALKSCGDARNLTALVDGTMWESRGSIDLNFAVVNRETYVLATYNVIRLGLSYVAPGGQINTQQIEVAT